MKKVVTVLLLLIVLLVAFIATRPAHYHVERSAVIPAPAEVVFAQINDLHRMNEWSPWAKLDPHMVLTYAGPDSGVGASYHWTSSKLGDGRMTITESAPGQRVACRLEFVKPIPATSTVSLTLSPQAGGTNVVWAMDGESGFFGKAMSLFASNDKMIGPDFERGLANLKTVVEAAPASTTAHADSTQ